MNPGRGPATPVAAREVGGGAAITVLSARDPAQIDGGELGASIVIESTGKFREDAAAHLKGGARKVLIPGKVRIPGPGKGADLTVVVGVNGAS